MTIATPGMGAALLADIVGGEPRAHRHAPMQPKGYYPHSYVCK